MAEDFLLSSSVSKNYFMIMKSAQEKKKEIWQGIYKIQTTN